MPKRETASEQIIREVASWPGVGTGPGARGQRTVAFTLGRRELGHLHGDHVAHFGFPKQVWAELRTHGRIEPHPVFPDSAGPAARRIETNSDVLDVIALLRLNYDRAVERHGLPDQPAAMAREAVG